MRHPRSYRVMALFLLFLVCSSAAAQNPKTIRKETSALLKSGHYEEAFAAARPILDRPYSFTSRKEVDRIVHLFESEYPDSMTTVTKVFQQEIEGITNKPEVTVIMNRLSHYLDMGLFTNDQKHAHQHHLAIRVIQLQDEGSLGITLVDDLRWVPSSERDRIFEKAFLASLDRLALSDQHIILLDEVISYVDNKGPDSPAHRQLRARIDEITYPTRYLYGAIGDLYPEYSKAQLALIGPWNEASDLGSLRQVLIEHSSLKDPFSVQFRKMFVRVDRRTGTKTWCGQVNAKNSWGAYGGWDRISVVFEEGTEDPQITFADQENIEAGLLIDAICFGTETFLSAGEIGNVRQELDGDSLHPGLQGAKFDFDDNTLEVVSIVEDSAADDRGLRVGDRIIAANRQFVTSPEIFHEVSQNNIILFLQVERGGKSRIIQIR